MTAPAQRSVWTDCACADVRGSRVGRAEPRGGYGHRSHTQEAAPIAAFTLSVHVVFSDSISMGRN